MSGDVSNDPGPPPSAPVPRAPAVVGVVLALSVACGLGCGGGTSAVQVDDDGPPGGDGKGASGLIAADLADEDDLEGQVRVYTRRLERSSESDELYPSTLERLAIAHSEYADELAGEGDETGARAQREASVARFWQLVEGFPAHEGTPAAHILLAYEALALDDRAQAQRALERVVARHPTHEAALDARVGLAELALEDGDPAAARTILEGGLEHVDGPDKGTSRSRLRFMLAAVLHNVDGDTATARLHLQAVVDDPDAPEDAVEQATELLQTLSPDEPAP